MRVPVFHRAGLCVPVLILLAAFCLRAPALAADVYLDGVVALVNGKAITKYEVDERMRPAYEQLRGRNLTTDDIAQLSDLRRKIIDQMVDDMLIQDDAERYKLKITDQEVDEQIKDFLAKRNISQEEFKRQLGLQRMTRDDFARNMRRDMVKHRLIGGLVTSKVVVTDSEVEERYKERKAEFSKDSMVQLSLILVPSNMNAADLKTQIESGQISFADAANKYSLGPGAGQGGDIGFIAWKDLAPEWNAAIAGLKPGQISQPVRIQDSIGLLQVVGVKEGEELPLAAVRDQIYQSLHEAKFEKVFQEYLQKLREKAVIEYKQI